MMILIRKHMLLLIFLYISLTSITVHFVDGEIFTSLSEMEELLETEAVLISNLELYIEAQEEKIDYLKRRVKDYQKEHAEATADIATYLSNPISAYLLTKRLTSDWRTIENFMEFDVGGAFLENVTNYRSILKFPSDEDLNGAAVALTRLQDTYKLDTSNIAKGELNGIQYSSEMSANDCFEMGRQSYLNSDFYHTALWMREAMDRLNNEINSTSSTSKADILEYLAFSIYKQGNVITALQMTNELLEIIPDHERASGNKVYYEKELGKEQFENVGDKKLKGDDGSDELESQDQEFSNQESFNPYSNPSVYETPERILYEKLCRNEVIQTPRELSKLTCKYVTNNSAFLKIAPLKLEVAHLKPLVVIYHDVLADAEIEMMKQMARPRFQRATVQNHKTGELEVAAYRISKSAWLRDEEHNYIKNIGKRVEDMTGLTVDTAEELQVVNYGIGGHYEPHFDFARKEETNAFKSLGTGNRIATVLFYMSDVQQGGATVFPALRVALWPKKGTAAFWFNLHASGEGDYTTRHAACPVLTGTKWVANKWLHELGQEIRRPCELKPDHPLN